MKTQTDLNGITYPSLKSMCDAYGITSATYLQRIKRGMSQKEALTKPLGKRSRGTAEDAREKACAVIKPKFVIKSRYPSEEYARYLKWQISNMTQELQRLSSPLQQDLRQKISQRKAELQTLPMYYLRAVDLILLGEDQLLRTLFTPIVQKKARDMTEHPDRLMQDILIFSRRYNLITKGDKT